MKVLVLGAGVVGVASAWYLSKAGHAVTVVDRQPDAGTAEFNGYDTELNQVRCQALLRRTHQLFPELRPAGEAQFWCGLRSSPVECPVARYVTPRPC